MTGRNLPSLEELKDAGIRSVHWDMLSDFAREKWPNQVLEIDYDVIILNAGVGVFKTHEELSYEETEMMMRINTLLPIHLASYHSRVFQDRNSGHLIFIGSLAAKMATPKASVYAASKHAIDGYVQSLRMELQRSAVKVSVLHAGPIDTPFIDKADATGQYKKSLGAHLLSPQVVTKRIIELIDHPKGEVLLPGYLGVLSKLTKLAPLTVEKWGRRFYNKK